jgi:hypothetical protein
VRLRISRNDAYQIAQEVAERHSSNRRETP